MMNYREMDYREKELEKIRKEYMEGKISPKEYIEKALTFKDGDSTRRKILMQLEQHRIKTQAK